MGWVDAAESDQKKIDVLNLTIRIRHDDVPISGRIVDLQGKPLPRVSIKLGEVLESEDGDLSAWITASKDRAGGSYEIERKYLAHKLWSGGSGLPGSVSTDSDGRFSLNGVGGEHLIRLTLSGPTIRTKEIGVLTRSIEPFTVNHGRGSTDWGVALYYGARFTYAAAPTKPVVGIVRDKDTGKPLAGVRIECNKTADYPVIGMTGIAATTDGEGRYRLIGLPKGRGNRVLVFPSKGQPYLPAGLEIPDNPGLEPVVFDISLTRGIVIEGRVTDKRTGEPLKSYVEYNVYRDNPHLSDAPGFGDARIWGQHETEPDGHFRVIGLPGRGLICALYIGRGKAYLRGTGLPDGRSSDSMLPVVPDAMLGHFNAFSELDVPAKSTTFRRDLALESGVTRTVRVVDPEGKPLAGADQA